VVPELVWTLMFEGFFVVLIGWLFCYLVGGCVVGWLVKKASPVESWTGSYGFRRLRLPEFQENRHMKAVILSALRTGRLCPQVTCLVLISVTGWVDPRAIARPEGIRQWKIPMTPLEIDPATKLLAAQCSNQPQHQVTWLVITLIN